MDAVEEIKSRLSVDEVVGEYIELRRAGRNFKGLSPFTNERTPSLMVSPEKQIWHDFSSGRGGNIFSFIMEVEGVDFKGALDILARKAGVDLSQYSKGNQNYKKKKDQILEALELATKYYQQTLLKNEAALQYLIKKRQFSKQVVTDFRLGYSPSSNHALSEFLIKRGVKPEIIKAAGLSTQNYRGTVDMFRGRLMIPLSDPQGLSIGFTARILNDEGQGPKYINTPQTLVYDKSRHVFGLNLAKDAIRRAGYAVIVEGNLDVIASHQCGVNNVVATAGTAITSYQLKALERFATDIRLCFDQDRAGIEAAERAIAIAQGINIQLSIIDIPEGKDPDELIKKDPKIWQASISKPLYAVDWLIDKYKKQLDITSAQGKKEFTDIIFKTISLLQDEVEQEHYLVKLAELTQITKETIKAKYLNKTVDKQKTYKKPKLTEADLNKIDDYLYEDMLLSLLVNYPITRRVLVSEGSKLFFHTPERQRVYEFLETHPQAGLSEQIPEDLKDVEDYVKILILKAEALYSKFDSNERLREFNVLMNKTIKNNQNQRKEKLAQDIKKAEEAGDEKTLNSLLERFNELIRKD